MVFGVKCFRLTVGQQVHLCCNPAAAIIMPTGRQYDWMRYRLLPTGYARLRRQGRSTVGHDSPTARDLPFFFFAAFIHPQTTGSYS